MTIPAENQFIDPQLMSNFDIRSDDIFIVTYAKFGVLRMQWIVGQLLCGGDASLIVTEQSPWLELRHELSAQRFNRLSQQKTRRYLRTHLPATRLPVRRTAKYIYVGRDPRDLVWNLYQHHSRADKNWITHFSKHGLSPEHSANTFSSYWQRWIQEDGAPYWPYFSHLKSWWQHRGRSNVLFVHFLDIKTNLHREIIRIAKFLNIEIDDKNRLNILNHCRFSTMENALSKSIEIDSPFWNGQSASLNPQKPYGDWRDFLTPVDKRLAEEKLHLAASKHARDWIISAGNPDLNLSHRR